MADRCRIREPAAECAVVRVQALRPAIRTGMLRRDVEAARDDAMPAAAVPDEGRLGLTRARIGRTTTNHPPSAIALRAS
jgi:hypothetical protein